MFTRVRDAIPGALCGQTISWQVRIGNNYH